MVTDATRQRGDQERYIPRRIGEALSDFEAALDGVKVFSDVPECRFGRLRWIREAYRRFDRAGMEPPAYFVDWLSIFTPIERSAWSSIRAFGLPMRPQYPIGVYFADFADPERRVVIECDGREFHQDRERDAARDAAMHRDGWVVFRLTGAECMRPEIDWQDIVDLRSDGRNDEAERRISAWLGNSSDGVIRAIQHWFYSQPIGGDVSDAEVFETLQAHTSAPLRLLPGAGRADHA